MFNLIESDRENTHTHTYLWNVQWRRNIFFFKNETHYKNAMDVMATVWAFIKKQLTINIREEKKYIKVHWIKIWKTEWNGMNSVKPVSFFSFLCVCVFVPGCNAASSFTQNGFCIALHAPGKTVTKMQDFFLPFQTKIKSISKIFFLYFVVLVVIPTKRYPSIIWFVCSFHISPSIINKRML